MVQKAFFAVRKTAACLGMENNRKDLQFGELSQTPLQRTVAFIGEVFIAVIKQQNQGWDFNWHRRQLMQNNSYEREKRASFFKNSSSTLYIIIRGGLLLEARFCVACRSCFLSVAFLYNGCDCCPLNCLQHYVCVYIYIFCPVLGSLEPSSSCGRWCTSCPVYVIVEDEGWVTSLVGSDD